MPNACAGIATVANQRCSGVSEGGRVTFNSLRDAGVERLTESGARLLGGAVATSPGIGELRTQWYQQSSLTWQETLAGSSVLDDGTING
jgi:hypothetical protein